MEPVRMSMAPCGINSSLCYAYQRVKNPCDGCLIDGNKPNSCRNCVIRDCPEKGGDAAKLYVTCEKYPCKRMKDLSKRYSTRYGVDIDQNMRMIEESGFEAFCAAEKERWTCPGCGNLLCMHHPSYAVCGEANRQYIGSRR